MAKIKDKPLNALKPFINYLQDIGGFRKIGMALFMLSCGRTPSRIISALTQPGTTYGFIFLPDKKVPLFVFKGLIVLVFAVSAISMVTGVPYADYLFFTLVVALTSFAAFLARSFSIARTGFLVQFRIPENYYSIEQLIKENWSPMSLSKDPSVRYSAIVFQELEDKQPDSFKLLMILEGLFAHFDIKKDDLLSLSTDNKDLESILMKDRAGAIK